MAQVTPPMAPTNASLPVLVTPCRPEHSKNIGVRTPSTDDVSQPDEDLEADYIFISSVAQQGLTELKDKLWQMLNE